MPRKYKRFEQIEFGRRGLKLDLFYLDEFDYSVIVISKCKNRIHELIQIFHIS